MFVVPWGDKVLSNCTVSVHAGAQATPSVGIAILSESEADSGCPPHSAAVSALQPEIDQVISGSEMT